MKGLKMLGSLRILSLCSLLALFASIPSLHAADDTATDPLEKEMQSLDLPNHPPAAISREKLYSAQTRYTPLQHVSEITAGVAQNYTGNSFLTTRQFEVTYRFHFNDRWSLGASGAFVGNQFTDSARRLQENDGILPEVPFARERYDLLLEANLFYGKFRISNDRVFYFDNYLAVGPGLEKMNFGDVGAAVADFGLVFWLGHRGSVRFGLKDYYYNETYRSETTTRNNIHAHLDLGLLL